MSKKKKDPFAEANKCQHSVYVEKFSFMTYINDGIKHLPPDIKKVVGVERRRALGRLWRARCGKGSTWSYGWSAQEALTIALEAYRSGKNYAYK